MDILLTIFFFILIIGVLVLVHELGHFIAAKLGGVEVKEFAIGFGKTLYSKTFKGTKYCINIFPLGGYVNLEGETETNAGPNAFRNKKFRIKLFVLVAGVTMNILLASLLFSVYLASNGYKFSIFPKLSEYNFSGTESQNAYFPLKVVEVDELGVSAGILTPGDIIVSINGNNFSSFAQFREGLKENLNKTVTLGLLNFDTYAVSTIDVPLKEESENGGILNVTFSSENVSIDRSIYFLKYPSNILSGISLTYDSVFYQINALGKIISDSINSGNFQELSNTVGGLPAVTNQIGQIVQFRVWEILIPLTALISVSLAVVNILPFPALDGGQILVFGIEKIRGKKIPDKILGRINLIGFGLLIFLAIIINIKDVIQLDWIGGLLNFIKNIFGR